jgi:hypothetical protein
MWTDTPRAAGPCARQRAAKELAERRFGQPAPGAVPVLPTASQIAYARQTELRITLQKLAGVKCLSLSASTSALTLPKVVSGLCLMPS